MEITPKTKCISYEKRLLVTCLITGFLFSLLTVYCGMLRTHGAFQPFSLLPILWVILWTLVYSAALYLIYSLMNKQIAKPQKPEGWFSRLTGNGFVVFLMLVLCWTPIYLGCFPGHFSADSQTQFYSYYNEAPYAHHPLLHTEFLGACLMFGINQSPEGEATYGLALYCAIQLILMAIAVGYACWWMRRRKVPVWARLVVTLFFALHPFYAIWNLCPQKDVLFAAFVMVFCLQLADLWQFGMKPLRLISFIVIAVLMMLFRNNGVYALALLVPFGIWLAKGKRIRMGVLLTGCMVLYLAINNYWIYQVDAERGSKVEILSVPLQQIGLALKEDPEAFALDTEGVLETLYADAGYMPDELYDPQIADYVKWAVDYELLDENLPELFSLWARLLPNHLKQYAEAFLIQNLPYLLPYSDMLYYFDFHVYQLDYFPIVPHSYIPALRQICDEYDQTLVFMGIPGTRLISDTAFFVWLCIAGLAYAWYRRERGLMAAFGFLIAVWITSLLGPVAIIRYMLSFFYAVPVLLARLLVPAQPADA